MTSTDKPITKDSGKVGKNEQVLLNALQELQATTTLLQTATDSDFVAEVQPIALQQWWELACLSLTQSNQKTKRETFIRSVNRLVACSQVVEDSNGFYSLLQPATNAVAFVAQDNPLK